MSWVTRIEKNSVRERNIFLFALFFALFLLVLDQLSKWYIVLNFKVMETIPVIPPVLNITSARNPGAAWSILSGYGWLLLIFGIGAAAAMLFFFRRLAEGCAERYFALLMILSGIAGNSFDRAFHGVVVDFIHVHYKDIWHYPIFNVADMAICGGVIIFMLSSLFRKEKGKADEKC